MGQLPIKILVNPAEETGSIWAREIIRAEAQKAAAALVFEWGRSGNKIITRRKGIVSYEILVTGREERTQETGTSWGLTPLMYWRKWWWRYGG